ncbi:MAG: hypothetical protein JF888_06065 [Candidatus Dormibacteraeota bacterium]|uniref:Polyketide cyclase n=1 Tax=Candidatus Dormiibacter inghamiae TaxID=3127013 RepID=A0A934KIK2_9BACT|nr:hypothetical protein [Candidatus Dormibacteraeota bacterium]MBJ7606098.1 hypothetical protein [Candidatus Dormibacteraeota bacterium]
MHHEVTVEVDAAPEVGWAVLLDVERWPGWTASMKSVQSFDEAISASAAWSGPSSPGFQ